MEQGHGEDGGEGDRTERQRPRVDAPEGTRRGAAPAAVLGLEPQDVVAVVERLVLRIALDDVMGACALGLAVDARHGLGGVGIVELPVVVRTPVRRPVVVVRRPEGVVVVEVVRHDAGFAGPARPVRRATVYHGS